MERLALRGLGLVAALAITAGCGDSEGGGTGGGSGGDSSGGAGGDTTGGSGGSTSTETTTDTGTATDTSTSTNTDVMLPAGCSSQAAACNPVDNQGCDAGQACDLGDSGGGGGGELTCFDPPNDERLGAACDNAMGPFCQAGLHCSDGTCSAFCCSVDDCAEGESCAAIDPAAGTLGTCEMETMCGGFGDPCTVPGDCCSNHCHIDHCH